MLHRDPISATNRRRKRRPLLWLILIGTLLGVPGYFFGPRLYYQFSDDPLARIARRAGAYLELKSHSSSADVLLKHIDDSLTILAILEKDQGHEASIQYHTGLFYFHELILRAPVSARNLTQLAGRGYLPGIHDLGQERKLSPARLGSRIGSRMRRSLALDPDLAWRDQALLAIAFGDLFYTARTDPVLRDYVSRIERKRLPPQLLESYDWIAVALDVVRGRGKALDRRLGALQGGLELSEAQANLLRCFTAFEAQRYLDALRLARGLKSSPNEWVQLEAQRMEAEIVLKQRGPRAALPYFRAALESTGGKDTFLKSRVRQVTAQI